jgi:ABC-type transporter Mla subunit MlaD
MTVPPVDQDPAEARMKRSARGLGRLLLPGLVLACLVGSWPSLSWAAEIKTIENLSATLLVRQINKLADSNAAAAATVQRDLDRVVTTMALTTPEKIAASVQAVDQARQSLAEARKAAAALSDYVAANRSRLRGSQASFLPLADLNDQLEAPYHQALAAFFDACHRLLGYAGANFDSISAGSAAERQRYEELYQRYLLALDGFNAQNASHAQRLSDWSANFPDLRDQLPR